MLRLVSRFVYSIVPERSLEGMTVWNAMTDGRIFIVNCR
jgi:hypothetical protein